MLVAGWYAGGWNHFGIQHKKTFAHSKLVIPCEDTLLLTSEMESFQSRLSTPIVAEEGTNTATKDVVMFLYPSLEMINSLDRE